MIESYPRKSSDRDMTEANGVPGTPKTALSIKPVTPESAASVGICEKIQSHQREFSFSTRHVSHVWSKTTKSEMYTHNQRREFRLGCSHKMH